jgi:hypothetical protein
LSNIVVLEQHRRAGETSSCLSNIVVLEQHRRA